VVKGTYYDGSVKTLTDDLEFTSGDQAVAAVDQNGVVQSGKKGKTAISVSYHGVTTELNIHVKQMPPGQKKK
jgi:pectate disaccharide-lyase